MQRERGRGVNATNWRCHRTVARGVEYGFEMAAKFPSIALVKYRDEGRARRRRRRREWGGRCPESRAAEASCRGCRGRMHRNYANCGSVLARFGLTARGRASWRPARRSEAPLSGRPLPVAWRRMASRRRDTRDVYVRARYVRGRARLPSFHSAPAVSMDSIGCAAPRRVVGCCESMIEPLSPRLMTERGRSSE